MNKLRHLYLICSYTGVVCAFSRLVVYIVDCKLCSNENNKAVIRT